MLCLSALFSRAKCLGVFSGDEPFFFLRFLEGNSLPLPLARSGLFSVLRQLLWYSAVSSLTELEIGYGIRDRGLQKVWGCVCDAVERERGSLVGLGWVVVWFFFWGGGEWLWLWL